MTTKTKVILLALALVTSYAAGRWSAPEKVKIETKTVEVEKKTDQIQRDADRNRRTETTETEVKKPDGTVEKTKKTVTEAETHTQTDRQDTSDSTKTDETSKEITRPSSKVTIAALAGLKFSSLADSPLVYGVDVYKPILGPVGIGIWGLSNLTFGASIGLSF